MGPQYRDHPESHREPGLWTCRSESTPKTPPVPLSLCLAKDQAMRSGARASGNADGLHAVGPQSPSALESAAGGTVRDSGRFRSNQAGGLRGRWRDQWLIVPCSVKLLELVTLRRRHALAFLGRLYLQDVGNVEIEHLDLVPAGVIKRIKRADSLCGFMVVADQDDIHTSPSRIHATS